MQDAGPRHDSAYQILPPASNKLMNLAAHHQAVGQCLIAIWYNLVWRPSHIVLHRSAVAIGASEPADRRHGLSRSPRRAVSPSKVSRSTHTSLSSGDFL